jgi:hypothetical protein
MIDAPRSRARSREDVDQARDAAADLADARARLASDAARLDALAEALGDGALSAESYRAQVARIVARRDLLAQQVTTWEAAREPSGVSAGAVAALRMELRALLADATPESRRALVGATRVGSRDRSSGGVGGGVDADADAAHAIWSLTKARPTPRGDGPGGVQVVRVVPALRGRVPAHAGTLPETAPGHVDVDQGVKAEPPSRIRRRGAALALPGEGSSRCTRSGARRPRPPCGGRLNPDARVPRGTPVSGDDRQRTG